MQAGSADTHDRGTRARLVLLALGIVLVTAYAFLPSLDGQWLDWDDDKNFTENEAWRGLSGRNVAWMLTTFHQGPWQPLSWLTLGLDHELWGMDARGFHRTNVILQCLAALAYFGLARALFARVRALGVTSPALRDVAAALAALAFAVHPLRVESVAWITERRDVLSGVFYAACLWAWVVYASAEGAARRRAWILAFAAFAAALAAKGTGMTLPLGLLALDVFLFERWNGRLRAASAGGRRPLLALGIEKWPFLVLSAIAAVLAWWGQSEHATVVPWDKHGLVPRLAVSAYGLVFYVWKTLWPTDLIALVRLDKPMDPMQARFFVSGAIVALVTVGAWFLRRRAPAVVAALLFYAILLAPVVGLTQTGPHLVADRYSYLPCLSFPLLFGAALLLSERLRAGAARIALAAGIVLVAILVPRTRAQCRHWHDNLTLWTEVVRVLPADAPAWRNLTHSRLRIADASEDPVLDRTMFEAVLVEAERGLARVQDAGLLTNASLAAAGLAERVPERASEYQELALAYGRRAFARMLEEAAPNPSIAQNSGLIAAGFQRPCEAVGPFSWLADHVPDDPEKPLSLGQALVLCGRHADALLALDRAREMAPDSPRVWIWRAHALDALGRRGEAIASLERGISLAEALPPELAELPAEMDQLRALLASWKSP